MASKPFPLKKSSDYRNAALNGQKRRLSFWLTIQTIQSKDNKNYFGITISSKVAHSVVRNKLKRWVRACVQNEPWPRKYAECQIVFVFRQQRDSNFFKNLKFQQFVEIFRAI